MVAIATTARHTARPVRVANAAPEPDSTSRVLPRLGALPRFRLAHAQEPNANARAAPRFCRHLRSPLYASSSGASRAEASGSPRPRGRARRNVAEGRPVANRKKLTTLKTRSPSQCRRSGRPQFSTASPPPPSPRAPPAEQSLGRSPGPIRPFAAHVPSGLPAGRSRPRGTPRRFRTTTPRENSRRTTTL